VLTSDNLNRSAGFDYGNPFADLPFYEQSAPPPDTRPDVSPRGVRRLTSLRPASWCPDVAWRWLKWTFGFWSDPANATLFGIDFGPLEIVWRLPGYRP
jgi:hypothetical protein